MDFCPTQKSRVGWVDSVLQVLPLPLVADQCRGDGGDDLPAQPRRPQVKAWLPHFGGQHIVQSCAQALDEHCTMGTWASNMRHEYEQSQLPSSCMGNMHVTQAGFCLG